VKSDGGWGEPCQSPPGLRKGQVKIWVTNRKSQRHRGEKILLVREEAANKETRIKKGKRLYGGGGRPKRGFLRVQSSAS